MSMPVGGILIRYVVVDNIDFEPMWDRSAIIRIDAMAIVAELVLKIQEEQRSLQNYDSATFDVLKILKPVPQESALPGHDSETLKRHGQGSLRPILQRFRERTAEAKKPELANDYVQRLPDYTELQTVFEHEVELISAILVRHTTPGERAEKDHQRPLEPGMTFRHKNLLGIISGSPPSETSGHHGTHLRAFALMDRPENRYTFPVVLFDKNLALLQYRLDNLDVPFGSNKAEQLFPNEGSFYDTADKFIDVAIRDYPSEEKRLNDSKPFLKAIFGESLELEYKVARIDRSKTLSVRGNASTTKFDGAYVTKIKADQDTPITWAIIEAKNKYGDPLSQMTKGFAEEVYGFKACILFAWLLDKNFFESTYFPKIFIALNGHKLEISIAVCLETVVVNEILSLDMRDNMFRGELKQKLARIAVALKECSTQLNTYYSELKAGEMPLSYFPSPTLEPSDAQASEPLMRGALEASPTFPAGLKIVGRLGRNNVEMDQKDQPKPSDMCHHLFLATIDAADDSAQLVVLKLAKQYGAAAHHCLASETLAPKLFLCQCVIGNLIVVVMERVKGRPLSGFLQSDLNALNKPLIFKGLEQAISTLQHDKFVHGDLRAPNIIVDDSNLQAVTIKVIDFDWAAKHNEGFYPNTINMDELGKEWHGNVGPMVKMKMEHDTFAVFNVLGKLLGNTPCKNDILLG